MRKLTSITLILCLCYTWMAYHLVIFVQVNSAKSEMRAFLRRHKDHKDMVHFKLDERDLKNLEWENKYEFRYHGIMYDVIEKKIEGGQYIICAIADKKETALLHEYQRTTKRNRGRPIHQLITTLYVLPADHLLRTTEKIIKKIFAHYTSALQDHAVIVLGPPPDAVHGINILYG